MQLIIDTANTKVTIKNRVFHLEKPSLKRSISPYRISSIAITSNALLNTAVLKLAATHQIPIYILDRSGKLRAQVLSEEAYDSADIRHKQYIYTAHPEALKYCIQLLLTKGISQQDTLNSILKKKPVTNARIKNTLKV